MNTNGHKRSHVPDIVIVGDFNTPCSSELKINKETSELNYSTDQTVFLDGNRTFHPTAIEFLSAAYGILSKVDHVLDHKLKL